MEVDILYGKKGLKISIPESVDATIMEPVEEESLSDPVDQIYKSFFNPMSSKPLKYLLENRRKGEIIIVVEDHTRPLSSQPILSALCRLFTELNIEDEEIKILVATGLHRQSNLEELKRMVGDEVINRFDIIFHNANDMNNLEFIGKTSYGNQIYLNSRYVNAGFKIITGYVEPHFFAGFSGGRKAIVPGIAGKDTILFNHSAKHIDSPARFGELNDNLIHKDALEAAKLPKAKPDFCINVTMNSNHGITKIASGNIVAVHNYLVESQKKACFKCIDRRFDIVIAGNGGYPLDLNLYQAVKSMAIGELAAKENGIIIAVNECVDGVGQDSFNELINSGKSPDIIYKEAIEGIIKIPDIWEIQVLARILMHFKVYVVSSMKAEELGNIGLRYAPTVEKAIEMALKELKNKNIKPSMLILPKGPLMLPECPK